MKFVIQCADYKINITDCLIIGIFENGQLALRAEKLDKGLLQFIKAILKSKDFQGKKGQTLLLYPTPGNLNQRILLVGCGNNSSLSENEYIKAIQTSINTLRETNFHDALLTLPEIPVTHRNAAWKIKKAVEIISDLFYRFDHYKSTPCPKPSLKKIILSIANSKDLKICQTALQLGLAVAEGVDLTKNLSNTPSNVCTPAYLADQAKKLGKDYRNLTVKILDQKQIEKLGMGAFLAVAKGSQHSPKLISFEYKGGPKKQAPIVFVGKGITFDTGGISLKPADSMVGMKYDMCGAATVFGVIKAAATLRLPLNIVGIVAAAENMPSGEASKPEDIVTTMSGQTVEIMNTDAEGRLILCDALTYCERFKPAAVIDIATLTGAVVIALGLHASGLVSNSDDLANDLLEAGLQSHDRAWRMPLWEEYQEQLYSPFADMSNVGGRAGGMITAACFLSRFAKKYSWAHLDVAGTAAMMMGGNDRYATGRPVPLLVQFLINQCIS